MYPSLHISSRRSSQPSRTVFNTFACAMIPYEALLPYGVMFSLLTVCGGGLSAIHFFRNDYKRDRWNLDRFDSALIERDYRLTGSYRGQSDSPTAPDSFKINSIWKLSKPSAS